MTRDEWAAQLAARAADAEKLGATAPLGTVLRTVLEELDGVDGLPTTPPAPDVMLTLTETAARLNVERRWLTENRLQLPFLRTYVPGGLVRVSDAALRRWLATR